MWWEKLLALLLALGLAFWALSLLRRNPASFSRGNLSKSLSTLGFLALGLIVFVALLVWYLKRV